MKKDSGRNLFSEIAQQVNKVKELAGPVYLHEEAASHFAEIQKQATKLSSLQGPVYLGEDNRNSSLSSLSSISSLRKLIR